MSFVAIKKLCAERQIPVSGANKAQLLERLSKTRPKPPPDESEPDMSVSLSLPLSPQASASLCRLHKWKHSYFSLLPAALLPLIVDCLRCISPADIDVFLSVAWGHFKEFRTMANEALDATHYRLVQAIVAYDKSQGGALHSYLVTFSMPIATKQVRSMVVYYLRLQDR